MATQDNRPMPGVAEHEDAIPDGAGQHPPQGGAARPATIRVKKPDDKQHVPRQPNDRDESPDIEDAEPREIIKRAYDDIMQGQVDTDLREQRGVEKTVDVPFRPATEPPQKRQDRS